MLGLLFLLLTVFLIFAGIIFLFTFVIALIVALIKEMKKFNSMCDWDDR